jgi:hypothetical protein
MTSGFRCVYTPAYKRALWRRAALCNDSVRRLTDATIAPVHARPVSNPRSDGNEQAAPCEPHQVKRSYEPAAHDDGVRVLVDRLWPRGIRKADAAVDRWLKELAPSTELRKSFGHDPER